MKPAEIPCRVLRPNSTDPGPSAESWLRKRKRGVDLPKPGPRPAQVMGTAAASAAAIAAGEVQAVDGLASRDAGGAAISTEAVDQGSEVATSSTTEPHVVARAAGSSRDGIRATPAPTYRVGTKRTHESEDGSATADGSPGASQSTSDSLAGQSAAAATAKTEPTWVQSKRPRLGDQEDAKGMPSCVRRVACTQGFSSARRDPALSHPHRSSEGKGKRQAAAGRIRLPTGVPSTRVSLCACLSKGGGWCIARCVPRPVLEEGDEGLFRCDRFLLSPTALHHFAHPQPLQQSPATAFATAPETLFGLRLLKQRPVCTASQAGRGLLAVGPEGNG